MVTSSLATAVKRLLARTRLGSQNSSTRWVNLLTGPICIRSTLHPTRPSDLNEVQRQQFRIDTEFVGFLAKHATAPGKANATLILADGEAIRGGPH